LAYPPHTGYLGASGRSGGAHQQAVPAGSTAMVVAGRLPTGADQGAGGRQGVTHRWLFTQSTFSAVRTPKRAPGGFPGSWSPPSSFMVGHHCVFQRGGGTWHTPLTAAISENQASPGGAHQQAVPVASTAMLVAGRLSTRARRGLSTSARAAGLLGTAFGRVWITPRGGEGNLRKGGLA